MAHAGGRPSKYNQKLADKICEQLSQGISLRTVCKGDKMPSAASVFNWLRTKKEFLEQYARAKEESADAMIEDILDIADDGVNDWMEVEYGENTVWKTNPEAIQRSRLRVDTRKWIASKMKPKKYGDKMDVTSGGKAIKGNAIVFSNFKDETDSEPSI